VQALYRLLLNRTGGADEVAGWVGILPRAGLQAVAASFLASGEFRADLFEAYYDALLHRPSDAQGLGGWVFSGLDASNVRIAFEATPEFFVSG